MEYKTKMISSVPAKKSEETLIIKTRNLCYCNQKLLQFPVQLMSFKKIYFSGKNK